MVHIRLLQQILKYDLILKKVHKSIQFQESHWLNSYIALNAKFRTD